ncbi:2-oxoglutarate dehydrogenase E1 component [Thiorhodovibrio frisius]|uniref:2-oxoglutarate dehydrogenase E1 component n=1 Tax=Thiorhodovibrio frisius TaxID=631362 RepID=H8Z6C9_9GAMM|nr:2-oxoglutarate dehydrogenase E1 component [Thiorhodovibrio frisius]EIC20713.1 2-oxoglutarate dehydrogenase, E1 component [Thiorhodovibrio frisius]WPL21461.1 2-oxoglutarate dehydrogenase E1 component [Thiorhodovibrio frisius]
MSALLELFHDSSAFNGGNAAFIEQLYERYLRDPASIEADWRARFDALPRRAADDIGHQLTRVRLTALQQGYDNPVWSPHGATQAAPARDGTSEFSATKQAAVLRLINAYRSRGHQLANLDPLRLRPLPEVADLEPSQHGLLDGDLDRTFHSGSLYGPERMPLREIIDRLKRSYCGSLGCEYMHITTTPEKRWLQKRIESYQARPELTNKARRWLLQLLTAAEGIEQHLHRRYVGQKRFSLEGGEALIPLLDELIQRAGRDGIREIIIGMAHRGRLNVLTNILGKPPQDIFAEFEGKVALKAGQRAGDVKYHLGFATDVDTPSGPVHLVLGFNPSHLEIINPVIQGSVRARQRRRNDRDGSQVLPVLIHGDSAFAGQGVVMETLQLSQTRSHGTGGTMHIIINNQIGFTTSNPLDTRSTLYCTDVAKMVQGPVFHVNGDDPEAVIFATRMALDFRNRFKRDVFVDLVCYRRLGHNEADEPAVTQPLMYRKIRQHPSARTLYAQRLIDTGGLTADAAEAMMADYRHAIEHGLVVTRPVLCDITTSQRTNWRRFTDQWTTTCDTGMALASLRDVGERLLPLPDGFELHPRVAKIWAERRQMAAGEQLINWGFAENLAYASLLDAGMPVRLSGQDTGRGTFFHRHAKIHCQASGDDYSPLQHLSPDQGAFVAIDSILSEEAVLGFEYGFATAEPDGLTLWEAQFGDFANGAQVVVDQFIASAGTKWGLQCGLVMLLPHGLEGQGAEHSSARLERYLQLCAEHNIQVCVPTTPAQIFHLLRRQMLRPYRRPLIVMTPKSLLRHRLAVSALEDLAEGGFQPLISECDPLPADKIERVIFCSGKVYFDLLEERHTRALENVAIVRIEQLYPFPKEDFAATLADYAHVGEFIWCQEEAQNQGAWDMIKHRFQPLIRAGKQVYYVGRPASAAPAVGHRSIHLEQQQRLIDEALTGRINPSMNHHIDRVAQVA